MRLGLGTKKRLSFSHVRRSGDDPNVWVCEGCSARFHRWAEPGWGITGAQVAAPLATIELPGYIAAGMTREEFLKSTKTHGGQYFSREVQNLTSSAFVDYCIKCAAKAQDARRELESTLRASQPAAPKPAAGYNAHQIFPLLDTKWATPADYAEWRCANCHKRVSLDREATFNKDPERPAMHWDIPAKFENRQLIAQSASLDLCSKCVSILGERARAKVKATA